MKFLSMFTALMLGSQLAYAAPVVVARPVVIARPAAPAVARPTAPAVARQAVSNRVSRASEPVSTPTTSYFWFYSLFGDSDRCEKTAIGKCKE